MTKQEVYEQATFGELSNPNGTRMDIIFLAMDIWATQQKASYELIIAELKKEIERLKAELKTDPLDYFFQHRNTGL